MSEPYLLEVKEINAGYSHLQVIWDISIKVEKNSIVSIIGANGAGKSTLVKAIAGIIPVMSGKIEFKGKDITRVPAHERVKEGIALVPDERGLFPDMTLMENLYLGGYLVRDKKEMLDAIEWGFELFPVLKKRLRQNAGSLSGGEQQMLAVTKALAARPELLILDEPSSGLAPIIIDRMFEALVAIKNKGITTLLVEQNVRRSLDIGDYCYVLENGRLGIEGTPATLEKSNKIKELYLGM